MTVKKKSINIPISEVPSLPVRLRVGDVGKGECEGMLAVREINLM